MKPARPGSAGRWWLWPFGLAVLAVIVLSLLRWVVQPERLGRLLLAQAEASSGLRIEVASPARLGIWPRLHLQLEGLRVHDPRDPTQDLLRASRVSLYLPLSVLQGTVQIDAVDLDAPEIDLAAWRQRGPTAELGPPAPPTIPSVQRLDIRDGLLRDGPIELAGLELSLRRLLTQQPLSLVAQAVLKRPDAAPWPLRLQLEATNPEPPQSLSWTLERVDLGDHRSWLMESARGRLDLSAWPTPRLNLEGGLEGWPGQWPSLPETALPVLAGLQVRLDYDPFDQAADLRIEARGEGRGLRLEGRIEPLLEWQRAGDWLAPLPAILQVDLERLRHGEIVVEGFELRHDGHVPD